MIMRTVVELQKFSNKDRLNHYERCCRVAAECSKHLLTEADEEYLMLLERMLDNRNIHFRANTRLQVGLASTLALYNHGVPVDEQ